MKTKYKYLAVIQQDAGSGFEDVSEYETDSQWRHKEFSKTPSPKGRRIPLIKEDLQGYKEMRYPIRVIHRRVLN